MRAPLLVFCLTALTLVAIAMSGPALAASKTFINDGFPSEPLTCSNQVSSSLGNPFIQPGNYFGSRFTVPVADLPYALDKIEIYGCGGGSATVGWDV